MRREGRKLKGKERDEERGEEGRRIQGEERG